MRSGILIGLWAGLLALAAGAGQTASRDVALGLQHAATVRAADPPVIRRT